MKQIFYNSFNGRFSDNPRAIYNEIQKRNLQVRHLWCRSERAAFPDGIQWVDEDRDAQRAVIAESDVLIANVFLPSRWPRKTGAVHMQTWHGTPLKRIVFDDPYFGAEPEKLAERMEAISKFDIFLSPNRFCTEVLAKAFRFDGEIVETGYPRCDVLTAPGSSERAARLRNQLGIDPGKRVVLYAPTWRDVVDEENAEIPLDFEALKQRLGEDTVVLLRMHYSVSSHNASVDGESVIDVSKMEEISDLYLVADVLITDYSSAMFDYAITGRPILFFTYDLEHYRDNLRGFYFDFEAEAPGPLLRTSDEVIEALVHVDSIRSDYETKYSAFQERFCHLADGRASERSVDLLIPYLDA